MAQLQRSQSRWWGQRDCGRRWHPTDYKARRARKGTRLGALFRVSRREVIV